MAIVKRVTVGMIMAFVLYPLIHAATQGLRPEDVHSLGAFLSVVGAIYSVLAAFVIFVVWDQYNAVEKATAREAGIVEDLYRISRYGSDDPLDFKKRFAKNIKEYLLASVEEWDDLARGGESAKAAAALNNLEARLRDFPMSTEGDKIIYANLLDVLKKLVEYRDERIAIAKHRMPVTLINLILLLSATLALGFYLIPVHSLPLGVFIAVSVVGILLTIFEVLRDIDNPFRGVWNVSAEPFAAQAARIM